MVTPEVVEKEIGVSKDFNAFELRNAIVQKDCFKANQIVKYFDNNPKAGSLYSFLPLLFSYFQSLMIVHYSPRKNKRVMEGKNKENQLLDYCQNISQSDLL